jgi:hypothetical protein
MLSNLDQTYE